MLETASPNSHHKNINVLWNDLFKSLTDRLSGEGAAFLFFSCKSSWACWSSLLLVRKRERWVYSILLPFRLFLPLLLGPHYGPCQRSSSLQAHSLLEDPLLFQSSPLLRPLFWDRLLEDRRWCNRLDISYLHLGYPSVCQVILLLNYTVLQIY